MIHRLKKTSCNKKKHYYQLANDSDFYLQFEFIISVSKIWKPFLRGFSAGLRTGLVHRNTAPQLGMRL